ncbi:MAG: hypothetical protein JOZ10_04250 [Acidobacteria bacterium]|nr:hypothetical protein [Acidobacteriota bacterium]
MKKKVISVTEAARNFAECVNRVHYQNTTYVLLKNGSPFARLVPDAEKKSSGLEVARALEGVTLPMAVAKAWHRDLKAARKKLKSQRDKWQ